MAAITPTDIEPYLKESYTGQTVQFLVAKDNTLFDLLPKKEDAGGKYWPMPVTTAGGGGIAHDLATAQSSAGPGQSYEFLITFGETFAVLQILEKAIRASAGDKNAFLDGLDKEMHDILEHFGIDHSIEIWGNGGTAFGRRASASTNVITLTNADDVGNFFEGMTIVASDGDGSSSSHALRSGSTTVASVDREAGTVTLASAAAITSFANNDYLFRAGSFAGNVSQTRIIKGVQAWCPSTAPSSTAFFNVDRSQDTMLGGARLPTALQTGSNAVERIRKLASWAHTRYGCRANHCFVHTMQWEVISTLLQQSGIRPIDTRNYTGTFGYKKLEFATAYGTTGIMGDRHCPSTTAFLANIDEANGVFMKSMGPVAGTLDRNGIKLNAIYNQAGWEQRWATYGQLVVSKPSKDLARTELPAVA